jgi:xeroderma pigmentosum group C-complementing protein
VEEVLQCIEEDKLQSQLDQRSAEVLRAWKHFLLKLRIAERVKGYAAEGEADDEASTGLERSEEPEDMDGGFLPESDDEAAPPASMNENNEGAHPGGYDDMGGGFLPDSDTEMVNSPVRPRSQPRYLPDQGSPDRPLSPADEGGSAGGFISEDQSASRTVPQPQHITKAAPSKYRLIVVPSNASGEATTRARSSDPKRLNQDLVYDNPGTLGVSLEDPITVESSANSPSASVEQPITVRSSVNGSASASIEMLSRAPSQIQSRTQSVEVVSQDSEDNEGGLLLEDPEDEDAVPEWLMSD